MTSQGPGVQYHNYAGQMELVTGLLIGGTDSGLEAGGVDKTFIKDLDGMPYVPGSSLKGKVRALVEGSLGRPPRNNGGAHSCKEPSCLVCRLFGAGDVRDILSERKPTRLLFRDARFSDGSRKAYQDALNEGRRYFEIKTETGMDRNKGTVLNGALHAFERVPPGARFDVVITLRALPGDPVPAHKTTLESGIRALEADYLGGSGSRGYGKVKFVNMKWEQVAL